MTAATVSDLRSLDPVIAATSVQRDRGIPISFGWLRTRFGKQNGIRENMGRGTAVLPSVDYLDQYLYSYGPMIKSQWAEICAWMEIDNKNESEFRIIDYGCGQGLAGLMMFDIFGRNLFEFTSKITLIEPSDTALIRAEAVYSSMAPGSEIYCIHKYFDDLLAADLQGVKNIETIHIFSNVLDIDRIDQFTLFRKALTPGRHAFIIVSHDRNFDGGSSRIFKLKEWLELQHSVSIFHSDLRRFKCNNPSQSDAIGWFLQLDVSNV